MKNRITSIIAIVLALVLVIVLGTLGYKKMLSPEAKVKSIVQSYYKAQSGNNLKETAELESQRLKAVTAPAEITDGQQTQEKKSDERSDTTGKLSIVAVELSENTGTVTGQIKSEEKDIESIPVLIQLVKEDGKWKVDLFNVGLVQQQQ